MLKLAKLWSLDTLRPRAIKEYEKLLSAQQSPLEKILLGKKYTISKWLIEGYEAFGKRDEMVSATERAQLGLDTYIRIVELRERAASHILQDAIRTMSSTRDCGSAFSNGTYPPGYADPAYTPLTFKQMYNYKFAIKDIFADELKQDREYAP